MSSSAWLMIAGGILVVLGVLIRWKVSNYDLKDAAFDSAITLARGKRTAENPTALEAKYRDIQNQPTWTGKATKTAGTVAGHFFAQVVSVVALFMILGGLLASVVGYFWR